MIKNYVNINILLDQFSSRNSQKFFTLISTRHDLFFSSYILMYHPRELMSGFNDHIVYKRESFVDSFWKYFFKKSLLADHEGNYPTF